MTTTEEPPVVTDRDLMPGHAQEIADSCIAEAVRDARGYETLYGSEEDQARLHDLHIPRWAWRDPMAFPGLLIPMYRVTGEEIGCQFKPAIPQEAPGGKRQKYASQSGVPNRLDVPPSMSDAVRDPTEPLWITEGIKKADCLASYGRPVLTLTGVFNWRGKHGTLGDWEDIPLQGRSVVVCFDSDARDKRNVMLAMQRLGRWLESKQAQVRYLIVPAEVDGTAVKGVDDYLHAGGTMDGLRDASMDQLPSETRDATFTDRVLTDTVCDEELDGRFRWASGLGWMQWTGRVWKEATEVTVIETVSRWALEQYHQAVDAQHSGTGRDLSSVVDGWRGVLSAARVGAIVRMARGTLECEAEGFDRDPNLLNCPNGIVDLRTGVLTPPDPDQLMTKIAGTDFVKEASHPDWTKALTALPDDVRDWYQLRIGQAATGHMTPDDLILICQGGGSNAKSTIYDACAKALGKYHVQVSDRVMLGSANDNHPTEMMDLMGARYAVLEETPEARRLDTNRAKKLAGTQEVTARRIRQDPVTFGATHSLFINSNHKPVVDETDHGTWRRLALVRWPYTYRKTQAEVKGPNDRLGDPTLRERCKADPKIQEAVLAWVVEGARRWYAMGTIMPPLPDRVEKDTEEWRRASDLILAYTKDRLEFDPDSHVIARELFADFNAYIKDKGQREWSDKTFVSRFGGHDLMTQNPVDRRRIKKQAGLSRPGGANAVLGSNYHAWLGLKFASGELPGDDCQDCPDDPFGGPAGDPSGVPDSSSSNGHKTDAEKILGGETVKFTVQPENGKAHVGEPDQDQVPSVPSADITKKISPTREVNFADGTHGTRSWNGISGTPVFDLGDDPFQDPPGAPEDPPADVPAIDLTGPIGIDLETADASTAFTYGPDFVRLAGVIDQHGTMRTGVDPAELVRMIGQAPEVYMHNGFGFDGPALAHWHGMDWKMFTGKLVDTEPLARQAHPPRSRGKSSVDEYDLDHVALRYGVIGKTDDLKALARKWGGYDKIPKDDAEYNAYLRGDLKATKGIREILPTDAYTDREHRILPLMGQMTLNGFKVDRELLQRRLEEGREKKAAALESLHDGYGLPLGRTVMRGRGKARHPVFEPSKSPLATTEGIAWLEGLWNEHGVTRPPRTDTGKLSTAAERLDTVADNPRCPEELREALGYMRTVTTTRTVYQTAATYLTPQGRVHPKVSMRQASGRGSVTEPGLTVFGKRDGKHIEREIFVADDGHVLITCDLSQVDMRAIAGHCQDPAYMDLFTFEPDGTPKDAHSWIAKLIGVLRQDAKAIGHGWNYGLGAKKMIEDGKDPKIVYAFVNGMEQQFPGLMTWRDEVRRKGADGEILDNGFGRLMRCDPQWAYTVAPALMGQGGARDITCEVLLRLMDKHPDYAQYLRAWIHDEFVFSVPVEQAEEIGAEIAKYFTWEWRGVPILNELSKPAANWGACSEK